jgi:hypothetical protein
MAVKIDARLEAADSAGATAVRSAKGGLVGSFGGDLFGNMLTDDLDELALATTGGVGAATTGLKTDLRKAIADGGLGGRLANAVQSATYPKGGKPSLNAAGFVYVKGRRVKDYLDAYAEGAVITAKNGSKYLAIPTDNAKGLIGGSGRSAAVSAGGWRYRTGVPTTVIPTGDPAAPFVIVANLRRGRGKRGGYRAPTASALKRGDTERVVLFVLVPLVRVPKRISTEGLAQRWADRVPDLIEQALT